MCQGWRGQVSGIKVPESDRKVETAHHYMIDTVAVSAAV